MPEIPLEQAIEIAERFRSVGNREEAIRVYRQIAAAGAANPRLLNNLGICLGELNRVAEARPVFQQAVEMEPTFLEGWSNLSIACEKLNDLPAAIAARRKAIELSPQEAEHYHRLGTCLGKSGELDAALAALRKSLELNPQSEPAHHDYVLALCRAKRVDEAEKALFARIERTRRVVAEQLRPIAEMFKAAGDFQHATDLWRRAAEADPRCAEAFGQLSMCLITLGDYKDGWALYERRWDCDSFSDNSRRDPARQWGTAEVGRPDVAGKSILIYSEQGIGDTIQFTRYAALFARQGARVIVQCSWPVKTLLERCAGVRLTYASHEEVPAYDWHIPVMSLPYVFGTTVETIPAEIPYITVDPRRSKTWAARVAARDSDSRLRVGLAWAGNPKHKNDGRRSIHPDLLAPLGQIPGIAFFSLQKANENEKAAIQPSKLKLIDFTTSLHDFSETAALIDQLDLVICADTAVAHLAGALGKAVWTLLPFVPDFRWGLSGEKTPWYPTMRLFRQRRHDDWTGAIDAAAGALKDLAETATDRSPAHRQPSPRSAP
jgi:tetratricopeptide (TPR) repeat protein